MKTTTDMGQLDANFWLRGKMARMGKRCRENVGGRLARRRRVWTSEDGHLKE